MNFVGTSNSESVCTNHPSQLYTSCSINFRETDQDDLYGRIRLGEANIINRTGTKRFVVPMYPGRTSNDDNQKNEGNRGRKIWLSWLQYRNNLPSYHHWLYVPGTNRTRSQIPRRGRFINENYTAERWYIIDKKEARCPDPNVFLTTLSFFSGLILHYIIDSLFLNLIFLYLIYATWYEIYLILCHKI